ncbi:MAG: hypothetical protein JO162_11905 [Alphaproteobacteria bacterium]|nr:hypothetical protein [Alphaproteobacteria bacterium]MBV9016495.1 hypothetical protein [Alphaproteobacteria bacterium]MBV9152470.1 hypothetical protein [Alphaproteobacteria bacterium]MBV9583426.1 hypothetical protein [Alphaproteobacteria bacterium]
MPVPTFEAIHDWHDFFVLLGTGAATLIGAMFVVVSIGSSFLTEKSEPQIRAYMTPTVIHLSTVLLGSILAMLPPIDGPAVIFGFGLIGIAGLVYSGRIALDIAGRADLLVDRIWYGIIPTIGYAVILAGAVLIGTGRALSIEALAVGLVLLLIASIRNSWDMIVFFAQRSGGPT